LNGFLVLSPLKLFEETNDTITVQGNCPVILGISLDVIPVGMTDVFFSYALTIGSIATLF